MHAAYKGEASSTELRSLGAWRAFKRGNTKTILEEAKAVFWDNHKQGLPLLNFN